eukprot:14757750-Alexandrium_andersonii.AAC.1
MSASLVGSEMCIRDRSLASRWMARNAGSPASGPSGGICGERHTASSSTCLLYTSDAADDM